MVGLRGDGRSDFDCVPRYHHAKGASLWLQTELDHRDPIPHKSLPKQDPGGGLHPWDTDTGPIYQPKSAPR